LNKKDQTFLEDFLKRDADVKSRVRFLNVTGMASNERNNVIFIGSGFDVQEGNAVRGEKWSWNTMAGKPLQMGRSNSILPGGRMARLLGCDFKNDSSVFKKEGGYFPVERPFRCLNDSIQLSVTTEAAQANALDATVFGVMDAGFRETDSRWVSMSLKMAQKLLDTDKITMVSVELKNKTATVDFINRLKNAATEAKIQIDVRPWQEHSLASIMRSTLEMLSIFRNLFLVVVVGIVVMTVANTMMKSVNERIREIGTLRSLGFMQQQLKVLFTWEGFFLSVLSCGVGIISSLLCRFILLASGVSFKGGMLSTPIPLRVEVVPVTWMVVGSILIALASGTAWICARRASHMQIAHALHYV